MLYLLCVLCRSAIVYPLLFAKFGRFTPNRLALIGQKYALIGHFHFCRLALIGHGVYLKSLIMNKSSLKNASHVNKCERGNSALQQFSSNFFCLKYSQFHSPENRRLFPHKNEHLSVPRLPVRPSKFGDLSRIIKVCYMIIFNRLQCIVRPQDPPNKFDG